MGNSVVKGGGGGGGGRGRGRGGGGGGGEGERGGQRRSLFLGTSNLFIIIGILRKVTEKAIALKLADVN